MAAKSTSDVVQLADELAVAIALRALGRAPKPQELPPGDAQDTMGMETMFVALARLTSWVAVKNRIDDEEPERDFFSGARAKLGRKAGGGRGRGGTAQAATDSPGGGDATGVASAAHSPAGDGGGAPGSATAPVPPHSTNGDASAP